ncbi:MAG: hypothetical protein AAFN10_02065 [Bacteroidota bacterium]
MQKPISISLLFLTLLFAACSNEQENQEEEDNWAEQARTEAILIPPDTSPKPEVVEKTYEELNAILESETQLEIEKVLKMERPSVLDYFKALPTRWVFDECYESPQRMSQKNRLKGIKYQNIEAGYLISTLPQDDVPIVMYRNQQAGIDYIASLFENSCADYFCGGNLEGFCTLNRETKTWEMVTEQLLGQDTLAQFIWDQRYSKYNLILPEQGTDIQIIACSPKNLGQLGKLSWKQTHFEASLTEAGKAYFADF